MLKEKSPFREVSFSQRFADRSSLESIPDVFVSFRSPRRPTIRITRF
jgi:hypothetical protein